MKTAGLPIYRRNPGEQRELSLTVNKVQLEKPGERQQLSGSEWVPLTPKKACNCLNSQYDAVSRNSMSGFL